ncbi:hypothetical protein EDB89DRAFT_1912289 [Lactarius sanguifluus]|nr:hypothetical protein EDB89DRAFT_1912289 [Lactarius sanguifluus]
MSERRKTKEKQLNEVGSCAGGVGGNASGLVNRVGSAVVVSFACRDGMASARGFRAGGVLVEVEGDKAMSLHVARRRGSCSGDVITRPKPSSSSSAGIFACRDGMTSGRGFPRGGVLVVDVDVDGAISLRGEAARGGAFAWRSDGGELEAKDGGGGYGMMCGEAAAVTWLCKRKLVHAVATDVHFKKKKKLIWLVVTRLVTIVVAVGIVGDEMHKVAPLENSPPSGAPGHQAVATRKTPVDDDELDHVTAAATLPPRHITPPRGKPRPDVMPSRRAKTPADDDELGFGLTTSPLQLPCRLATPPRPMPPQPRHATITPASHSQATSPQHRRRLPRHDLNTVRPQPATRRAAAHKAPRRNLNTARKTPPATATMMGRGQWQDGKALTVHI